MKATVGGWKLEYVKGIDAKRYVRDSAVTGREIWSGKELPPEVQLHLEVVDKFKFIKTEEQFLNVKWETIEYALENDIIFFASHKKQIIFNTNIITLSDTDDISHIFNFIIDNFETSIDKFVIQDYNLYYDKLISKLPAKARPKEVRIEPRVTIWKNPKPKVKNKKDIEIGYKVLVDGYAPLLEVLKVTDKLVYVDVNNVTKRIKKEDAYPVFKQLTSNIVHIGNIITLKYDETPIVVNASLDRMNIQVKNIKDIYAKEIQELLYKTYQDGKVEYGKGMFKSLNSLKKTFGACKYTETEVFDFSHEHKVISTHYGISIDDITPKERSIYKTLKTTLDHPLNVEKKRWALLVGESGSGKTEIAVDYCNRTNKEYVKLQGTAQLTVDDIIGYKSLTTGEYIASLLRDAVEFGKVLILDEIDACNPNTLLVLNGLKQDYFQFPDALVKIHKDFKLIGTANALEYSEKYNARAPMDTATKNRFKIIEYNMKPHELALRYGHVYIKEIEHIERLTPREIEGIVLDRKIEEMQND